MHSRLLPSRRAPAARGVSPHMKASAPKPRIPRGKRGKKPASAEINQATANEFEREGLGVAPKE